MEERYSLENEAGIDDAMSNEEQEQFEQHVIQGDDDLRLVHHFLDEVFRESRPAK